MATYCRHPHIQMRARSSVSLRSGGSILQSKAGPFLASGEVLGGFHIYGVHRPVDYSRVLRHPACDEFLQGNTIHTYMVVASHGNVLKLVNTDPGFVLVLDGQKK